ncbi:hypothetical protein JW948_16710 [bacterium]|nr:hypothetical protein [bacterium]
MDASINRRLNWEAGLFGIFYFSAMFFIIQAVIDPRLIYQIQEPLFFAESSFFVKFLAYPGGLMEYLGAFLTQWAYYGWPGSLIITALLALVTLFCLLLFRRWSVAPEWQLLAFVPAVILLGLHSQYRFPLSLTLAFCSALIVFYIYCLCFEKPAVVKLAVFTGLSLWLYVTSGAVLLLFSALAILLELMDRRHLWLCLPYLGLALLLPYISLKFIFIISEKQAWLSLLPFHESAHPVWLGAALCASIPLFAVLSRNILRIESRKRDASIIVMMVVILGLGATALLNVKKTDRVYLKVLYLSRHGLWDEYLAYIRTVPYQAPILSIETNRALYHKNRLGDQMFQYPQGYGINGLVVLGETRLRSPMEKSDLMLDLGFVNEAIHWASETLSAQGETPYNLRQLTLLYAIKNDMPKARLYLERLKKTLLFRDWARETEKKIAAAESHPGQLHPNLFRTDYIVEASNPCLDFDRMLENNPMNRMVYEYYLAYCLLDKDLAKFSARFAEAHQYFPSLVPVHYEEAVLLYVYVLKGKSVDLSNVQIRKSTIDNFSTFRSIMTKHNGDPKAAFPEMYRSLKDTYWYYFLYHEPGKSS